MENGKSIQMAFGEILRELRTARGLSQERLAAECLLDRTYISLLERGMRQPTLTTLFALSARLGVKPSIFVARVSRRINIEL